ncbi:CHAT domain-containing protein [Dactylosporangium sucinum]|uniref:CHAT domain-containing protein n=1 Tax=Dactylosporangium sucinum TaxID=1424081 RepID=A0A917UBR8_9ACTN|nr:CHAT domain-containing protein [Dactylosporangium sucinum]GGM76867.1 hypothetical protein GCM10007977_092950 [Dactylosporangium sucinum]
MIDLLAGCPHCGDVEPAAVSALRAAAWRAADIKDWLVSNGNDALPACRWVSVHDHELLARLSTRPSIRDALYEAMARAWGAGGDEALEVTEFAALWGDPRNLPGGFPIRLKRGLQDREPRTVHEAYTSVVARLRPVFGGEAGAGLRRIGWIYLLADAAQAAFRAHDVTTAVRLWDETWLLIDELPATHVLSAQAVGHFATGYAAAVGHLRLPDAEWDTILDTAMERLTTAAGWLEDVEPSIAVASQVLGLGLSRAQICYVRMVNGLVGWITGEGRRLELLDQAEAEMWEYLPRDTPAFWTKDAADLPEGLRDAVARLNLERVGAAAVVRRDRLPAAAADALRLSTRPHHRFGALVGVARNEPNLARRVTQCERLLRETRDELYGKANAWQREAIRSRLADACRDLSVKLEHAHRPTAAWFWRREGQSWADRPGEHGQSRRPGRRSRRAAGPGPVTDLGPAQGPGEAAGGLVDEEGMPSPATNGGLAGIARNIDTEQAPGLVLSIMALVSTRADADTLRAAIALVDAWDPPLRRSRPGRLPPGDCGTVFDLRRTLLEAADEIAVGYGAYLRPELLNLLARQEGLTPAERLRVAEEALATSLEAAQWVQATSALRVILAVAIDAGDDRAAAYAVHAVCGIVQYAVTQSRGTADLIDLARQMTSTSTRVATILASRGHAELAFLAAHAGLGAINRIFADDTELIEEFELAEQFHQRVDGADDQLFEAMHKRLNLAAPRPTESEPTAYQPETLLACMPATAVYVQLFGERHGGFWAVGCVVEGGSRRWWATRLDVSKASLNQLRGAVWQSLRPKRTGRPRRTQALRQLHAEIVGRFQHEFGDVRDVIVVPHQSFAGLPLHAARGDDGFLIERHRLTYLPALTDAVRPATVSGSALVGGWDPAIGAPEEARELEKQLVSLGFDVVRPKTAAHGRRHYLNPEARWDVVHIAAHGDYHPWPRSLASELRLSRTVRLTAGDWLSQGCRASFVFVNACNVGRNVPHAGDVNGFPLALRIRGNVAEVSALCPVDSVTAGPFAQSFYRHWVGRDSLDAYHAACLDAIQRAEPPSVWAPYIHTGLPVTLSPRSRPVPNPGPGGGRSRSRGRGHRERRSR